MNILICELRLLYIRWLLRPSGYTLDITLYGNSSNQVENKEKKTITKMIVYVIAFSLV